MSLQEKSLLNENLFLLFITGLSHNPRPDKAEFTFNMKDKESYKAYIENIDKFLLPYNKENQTDQQKFEDCGGTI